MVGYQEIDEQNGTPIYAQLRYVCKIEKVGKILPDSDNGKIYGRFLTSPEKVIKLLNWGEVGRLQISKAKKIAQEKFSFKECIETDEYI